ncbi:MAG: hypothetical protein DWG80_03150 [Chloroflexi bacterium]|nr:hypothetical protein [Chloroflexota bacterium]
MSCDAVDAIAIGLFFICAVLALAAGVLPVVLAGMRLRGRHVPGWQRLLILGAMLILGGLIAWQLLDLSFAVLEHRWEDTFGVDCTA